MNWNTSKIAKHIKCQFINFFFGWTRCNSQYFVHQFRMSLFSIVFFCLSQFYSGFFYLFILCEFAWILFFFINSSFYFHTTNAAIVCSFTICSFCWAFFLLLYIFFCFCFIQFQLVLSFETSFDLILVQCGFHNLFQFICLRLFAVWVIFFLLSVFVNAILFSHENCQNKKKEQLNYKKSKTIQSGKKSISSNTFRLRV